MRLSDFDFHLPEALIALRPAEPRESARLLVVRPGAEPELADRRIPDLLAELRSGDVMVFNDTRVIPARLHGIRYRGDLRAKVEAMLHKRAGDDSWVVFARPAKKLAAGDRIRFVLVDEHRAWHFEGRVSGSLMEGSVRTGVGNAEVARPWRATRVVGAGDEG